MAFAQGYPMTDLMRMREAMSRLSQPLMRQGDGEEGAWGQTTWMPPVDIYETEDGYVLEAELPGFPPKTLTSSSSKTASPCAGSASLRAR